MRIVRLLLKASLAVTGAALTLVLILLCLLQVEAGRTVVSGLVGTLASTDDRRISLQGFHAAFDLDASLKRVTLSDSDGVWLDAEGLRIDWRPFSIFTGTLDIAELAFDTVSLHRLPVAPPGDGQTQPTGASSSGFTLPLKMKLDRFAVKEVNLGEGLAGAPVSLTAAGAAQALSAPLALAASLELRRIDGVPASLFAKARFEPETETLAFDIRLEEPRGGLAARLLKVEDLPAMELDLTGSGPLSAWSSDISLKLDGHQTFAGSAAIRQLGENRQLTFDLGGSVEPLVPPLAKALLLGEMRISGSGVFDQGFSPISANVAFASQTAELRAQAHLSGETINASATLNVSAGEDAMIALDLPGRRIAAGDLAADFNLDGSRSNAAWSMTADVAALRTTEVTTGPFALKASGTSADLTTDAQSTDFTASVTAADVAGLSALMAPLSGALSLTANGHADGAASLIHFQNLEINHPAARIALSETRLAPRTAELSGRFSLPDLARFSGFAGRQLAGSVDGSVSFSGDPSAQSGDLNIDAAATDLGTGDARLDGLFDGRTDLGLTATLAGPEEIRVSAMEVSGETIRLSGRGSLSENRVSADAGLSVTQLSRADERLEGELHLQARIEGPMNGPEATVRLTSPELILAGTPLTELNLSADAVLSAAAPNADISASADLAGQPLTLKAVLASKAGQIELSPLDFRVAGNSIAGRLAITDPGNPLGTLQGNLKINAPDLAAISPLVLTELAGRAEGMLVADPQQEAIRLTLKGSEIAFSDITIAGVSAEADLTAPYTPQRLNADIRLTGVETGAMPVHSARLTATAAGEGTGLAADIRLTPDPRGDGLSATGLLNQENDGAVTLGLDMLSARFEGLDTALLRPATIRYHDGETDLSPVELSLGSGSLAISGTVGQALEIDAALKAVPLRLANAFAAGLGLEGTLSGSARATGTPAAPLASWSISGRDLGATPLAENGISALTLTTSGTFSGTTADMSLDVTGGGGLALSANGQIGTQRPNPLNLTLNGTLPMDALRRPLLEAGLSGEGVIAVSGQIGGNLAAPDYRVTATPKGLRLTGHSTGLTFQNISGQVLASPQEARLEAIKAELATGGSVEASGSVGMGDGYPAQITLSVNSARYVDPGLVTAEANASVQISGPLASPSASALISGDVAINKADISIPEFLPGAIAPVQIAHVNAPLPVEKQFEELGGKTSDSHSGQSTRPPRLDIRLSAPGRIFIRGRGLDAELEGSLRVVGTTDNPQAIGAFSLRRGQLDILTRRLVFSRGTATFEGSLDPILDFAATTTVDSTTITVTVSGNAENPEIAFSSSPDMPQDEVLALLLFGKSIGNLSAAQIGQLAASIATLTGGSDSGPLASIRKSLGLDTIDINTDEDEGPSVAVGKYINDNIYLGVEQGTGSDSSRVTVDIDLDRGLKVRGEVGNDGESKAGIFFEREY